MVLTTSAGAIHRQLTSHALCHALCHANEPKTQPDRANSRLVSTDVCAGQNAYLPSSANSPKAPFVSQRVAGLNPFGPRSNSIDPGSLARPSWRRCSAEPSSRRTGLRISRREKCPIPRTRAGLTCGFSCNGRSQGQSIRARGATRRLNEGTRAALCHQSAGRPRGPRATEARHQPNDASRGAARTDTRNGGADATPWPGQAFQTGSHTRDGSNRPPGLAALISTFSTSAMIT